MKIYLTEMRYHPSITEVTVARETPKTYQIEPGSGKDILNHVWVPTFARKDNVGYTVFLTLPDALNVLEERVIEKIERVHKEEVRLEEELLVIRLLRNG